MVKCLNDCKKKDKMPLLYIEGGAERKADGMWAERKWLSLDIYTESEPPQNAAATPSLNEKEMSI